MAYIVPKARFHLHQEKTKCVLDNSNKDILFRKNHDINMVYS